MSRSSIGRSLKLAAKTTFLTSCVVNFAMAPYFECQLKGGSDCDMMSPLTGAYARSMSLTCFVSSAVLWSAYRTTMAAYRVQIELHDVYSPTSDAERGECAALRRTVTCLCLTIVVPVNAARLYNVYVAGRGMAMVAYFVALYSHNLCMCMSEARFVGLCYAAYRKFERLNRDMECIGDGIDAPPSSFPVRRTSGRPLADAVEDLRIRHRLIRESVDLLERLFAVPVGLSLLNLCVMALFDIYYHLINVYIHADHDDLSVFIVMWLVQYAFRFFVIVVTAHAMTKQALRSKEIISNISRHSLDVSTKEELQVFSNQISSKSMEFNICDLFTLNTYLFTSAIGAGITYLVVLIQMKASTDINMY